LEPGLETVQDYLSELGIKPNNIMSWLDLQAAYQNYEQSRQKLGIFKEKKVGRYFKNQSFQNISLIK